MGLAEACVEAAKLRIAQNASYVPPAGGDVVQVNDLYTCRICDVTAQGNNQYIITTRSVVRGSYTNIEIVGTIAASTFTILSWEEKESYNGINCTYL